MSILINSNFYNNGSWNKLTLNSPPNPYYPYQYVGMSDNGLKIAICTNDGYIAMSNDGGNNWSYQNLNSGLRDIKITPDGSRLYVQDEYQRNGFGSGDVGIRSYTYSTNTWGNIYQFPEGNFYRNPYVNYRLATSQNGSIQLLSVEQSNFWYVTPPGTITGTGLYKSTNYGQTFTRITGSYDNSYAYNGDSIVMNSSGTKFAIADFSDIYHPQIKYSVNSGSNWSGYALSDPNSNRARTCFNIRMSSDGSIIIAITDVGVFYTNNSGSTWNYDNYLSNVNNKPYYFDISNTGSIQEMMAGSGFYRSTNGGSTWDFNRLNINGRIAISSTAQIQVIVGKMGIFINNNYGL